jgi:tetratricopeptide (TPR) repeat protein
MRELGGRGSSVVYVCPGCGCAVEDLPDQDLVEPFREMLPRFLAYPFTAWAVVFMLVLSVLMALFSSPGALSKVIELLLFGVLLKYCFAVLRQTAQGDMTPPRIDERTMSADLAVAAQYWLVYILLFAAVWACFAAFAREPVAGMYCPAVAGICTVCLIVLPLILPALVMNLAKDGSLLEAINPRAVMRPALKIGKPYLAMCGFIAVLFLVPCALAYLIEPFVPAVAAALFRALASCYCFIIAHHLAGYVILQYRDALGYETGPEKQAAGPRAVPSRGDTGRDVLGSAEVLIREEKYLDALELISAETGGRFTDPELSGRYYHLLRLLNRHKEMIEHARAHLELLVKGGSMDTARNVYLECAAIEPSFNPRTPLLFRIAASLNEVGNNRAALEAYDRFIRSSPDDPMIPKAFFLAARIFSEKMLEQQRAAEILEKLISKYPDHEITPHACRYLRKMANPG